MTMNPARALTAMAASLLLTACAGPGPTSSPAAPASASGSASAPPPSVEESMQPSFTPTPEPTPVPDPAAVPVYAAGAMVQTHIAGLRVHARPGTEERVVTGLLPDGAELLVALGPIFVDDYGWYLVDDADSADPAFSQGWVATGFNPDPWLVPAVFDLASNPYLGGFAHDSDGEYGPVHLTDANVEINWIAAPPRDAGCSFGVDLRRDNDAAVPAIRATLGAVLAPGVLQSDFFVDHPKLIGDLFVTVTSDCRWALTFEELPAEQPSPSG